MLRVLGQQAFRSGRAFRSTAVTVGSGQLIEEDPFKVLAIPEESTREDLRNQFFELAKTNHPQLTGDKEAYDKIVAAYESAIKIIDEKSPIEPWDGISGMTYAQAWEGKDYWRKIWEDHWATRLAHMHKHNAEMTELAAKLKWREAQYVQVKDWMVLAKSVLPAKLKKEWNEACELAQATMLWSQTNKQNYKRYYISNQNSVVNMEQVYKEHEYWQHYESINWAEWDRFFAEASAWVVDNETAIRSAHNTEGPLGDKFEYLFKDRLKYAQMTPEEKTEAKALEEGTIMKQWRWTEIRRVTMFLIRAAERISRGALLPILLVAAIYGVYVDFQVLIYGTDVSISENGAVQIVNRKQEAFDYLLEGAEPAPAADPNAHRSSFLSYSTTTNTPERGEVLGVH
eukprot:CAMPEP_0174287646 /NCGR_PEP_ID=MMETSP0809-20121228/16794_1 /TAXON_ID=73025 ORGANISM="Eutreptiella gymnastica-like, Strain CCMP1594" /NCGR_SAMPLE_ID=MMETSP0809 /ASSEMBLY_ACC=CAM_ASM_000658 /LENGTH=398 /DNA_ID=CAMNT_0015384311 /DNA_START=18 /DNA_END=1214 /DNA_ORIENTATION=+